MRRNFIRYVSVGTVVVALAAAAVASAYAASSNRGHQFGPRGGLTLRGFGPGFGFAFGFPGGPGLGGRLGGGGISYADVLTPAADYLNVSLATLQSDLKGGKTLAQEATAKNKTAAGLVDAIVTAETKVLDAQKAAGWLTDAQESALLDNFKTQVTELVNNGPGVPPVGVKNGGPLQTAADYLGISVSDLIADLEAGKSLAQEATAKGKTVDGLVQAMLAPLKTMLQQRVDAGDITAAQQTAILNRATTMLTNLVNNTKPDELHAGLRVAGLRLALPRLFLVHR